MNITDLILEMMPSVVTRKNKCYNLVVMKSLQDDGEHIKVGYEHRSKDKTEVITVSDKRISDNGLRMACLEVMKNLTSDTIRSIGYEVKRA